MTRRERLEAKAARREEWAEKADRRAKAASEQAFDMLKLIPPGQPILVGHHSERGHRAHLRRVDGAMARSVTDDAKAKRHREKAAGLEAQLDRSVFSDDPDAIEQLEAKVANLERDREEMKRFNRLWRKHKRPAADNEEAWEKLREEASLSATAAAKIRRGMHLDPLNRQPYPDYALSNAGGRIRQAKQRITEIQRRQKRSAEAEAAGGVTIARSHEHNWATVTFAEKPDREILQALKAAGFHWGGGSWSGYLDRLPDEVEQLASE